MIKSILSLWELYSTNNKLLGVFLLAVAVGLFAFFSFSISKNNTKLTDNGSHDKDQSRGISFYKKIVSVFPMLLFGACISILLIIPFSALLFRKMQTVFFDYAYLWVIVPIIPVVAFFLIVFIDYLFDEASGVKPGIRIGALVLSAIGLLLCGSLGTNTWKYDDMPTKVYQDEYDASSPILTRLYELASDKASLGASIEASSGASEERSDIDISANISNKLTILAPPNITEYIHFYCGNVATIYGRDMWDYSMRAFSYTEYPTEYKALYEWMNYCRDYDVIYVNGVNFPDSYSYRGSDETMYDFLDSISSLPVANSTEFLSGSPALDSSNTASSVPQMYDNERCIFGGLAYAQLAKDCGVDLIVFQATEKTDTAALDHIKDAMSAQIEFISSNASEQEKGILGYYLLKF